MWCGSLPFSICLAAASAYRRLREGGHNERHLLVIFCVEFAAIRSVCYGWRAKRIAWRHLKHTWADDE